MALQKIHGKLTKLKFRKMSFIHNICYCYLIVLKFCTEHGSITAVLCAKFQNHWTTEKNAMDRWHFMRFDLKLSLRQMLTTAMAPGSGGGLLVQLITCYICCWQRHNRVREDHKDNYIVWQIMPRTVNTTLCITVTSWKLPLGGLMTFSHLKDHIWIWWKFWKSCADIMCLITIISLYMHYEMCCWSMGLILWWNVFDIWSYRTNCFSKICRCGMPFICATVFRHYKGWCWLTLNDH